MIQTIEKKSEKKQSNESKPKKGFTMEDCLDTIKMLASSQGFYGRMLNTLMDMKKNDSEAYQTVVSEWESQGFTDSLDFILYIEG